MRLLFMYFYEEYGTFKKGTIITASKKYTVEKESEEFSFILTKNPFFQDNFYSDNIELGAVIGENGTGKSVLINSLRVKENKYSFSIYEMGDGKFFYNGSVYKKQVEINGKVANFLHDIFTIYYSPIIDSFNGDNESVQNISDKQQFVNYEGLSFQNSLLKVENDEINLYLSMNKVGGFFQLKSIKILPYDDFFHDSEKFLNNHRNRSKIYKAILDEVQENKLLFNNLISLLSYEQKLKVIYNAVGSVNKKRALSGEEISDFFIEYMLEEKYVHFMDEKIKNAMEEYSVEEDELNELNDFFSERLNIPNNEKIYTVDAINTMLDNYIMYNRQLIKNRHIQNKSAFIVEYLVLKFCDYFWQKINYFLSIVSLEDISLTEDEVNLILKNIHKDDFDISSQDILSPVSNKLNIFIPNILSRIDQQKVQIALYIYFFKNNNVTNDYERINLYLNIIAHVNNFNINHLEFKGLEKQISIDKLDKEKCTISVEDYLEIYKELPNKQDMVPLTYELDPPLSSGQKAISFIFARIDNAIKEIKKNEKSQNILILLDEADLKLHLEWQREFINKLVQFLKNYQDKNFYVLYATHSPMILSDITDDRIVFLEKVENGKFSDDLPLEKRKQTFGANIYDLYHDSFFMDKYMGEFAFNKINDVINIVNLYKIVDKLRNEKDKDLKDYSTVYDIAKILKSYNRYYSQSINMNNSSQNYNEIIETIKNDKENLKQTIAYIGEPLLRNRLEDDINSIGNELNVEEIVNSLKNVSQEEITKVLKNYDENTRIKILKKLFMDNK